jgi:anthranilate phosphoribosyltransferase
LNVDIPVKALIEQLRCRIDLRLDQAREASRQLADPAVSEVEKGDFLVALKQKGESGEELGYFSRSFLELAIRPALQLDDKPSIDIVGTGGDRLELINVSTTCIFLLAAAGVTVLKHGNKAITSKAGSADVLEYLGIPLSCPPEQMAECVYQTGIGFFFAPLYHPAFRMVAPIRRKLAEQGIATVFNLLGPLLNPAGPTCQLTGVFSPTILEKYAVALREVGRRRAWVVHGQVLAGSGMDEISLLGETEVHEVIEDRLNQFHLFPDQLGFRKPSLYDLRGGDAAQNARHLIEVLGNQDHSSRRDLITINAAAGLVIAGAAPRMESGIRLANEILDSGHALEKLREFQRFFGR